LKIKQSVLVIADENPFAEALPGRKEIAESLTRLIDSVEQPFVLAINAGWGAGKTTFLKMWQSHLVHQTDSKCIYFSAWENDFAEDPLISLIGELTVELEKLKTQGQPDQAANEVVNDVKKFGAKVLKRIIPIGVKLASAGLIEAADLGLDADEIGKAAEDYAKKKIDEYEADKKTLSDFKKALEKFVQSIQKDNGDKPIIFIIDELDRCRPAYAIALLERLKHLFSVKGICFVLAIDRHSLVASIRAQYGAGIDAEGYLRRFIDLDYFLPEPDVEPFVKSLSAQFKFTELPCLQRGTAPSDAVQFFGPICKSMGLTLRDVEQCFARFVLILRLSSQTDPWQDYVVLPLVLALRFCKDASLYHRLRGGSVSANDLTAFMRLTDAGKAFFGTNESAYAEGLLIAALDGQAGIDKLIRERDDAQKNQPDSSRAIRLDIMSTSLSGIRSLSHFHKHALSNVFTKIEFANGFDPA
jgi:KAP family P-loop domain